TSRSATRTSSCSRQCACDGGASAARAFARAASSKPRRARSGAGTCTSATNSRSKVGEGTLVLVGTPIGNLGDLSPRAVEALRDADVIACEDTRRTRKLLSHAGVRTPTLLTVNDHSESRQVRAILARLDS